MAFSFRGLELHGRRMWERDRIVEALEFIKRHDMTALVLHETDLVQMVTYPRSYLDPYALWKSAPTRRGENAIENNRVYFDHILQLAKRYDIDVFIEIKEIGFPDEILELRPELMKGGVVCPSEPFWWEFITRKTDELLKDFPLLDGIIMSVGSTEGKASRAQNKCGCEVCARTRLEDWYHAIITATHRATSHSGKLLAVRDFAYKPEDQEPLIRAVDRSPPDIVFCIKAMPHDFYLSFPHNPAIGRLRRPQWIEYDAMGQFYGWGLFPCFALADLHSRIAHATANGVSGGIFRTEWERINDLWCLETLNAANAIAGAALARGEAIDAEETMRRWLADRGHDDRAAAWLGGILADTWPIIRSALYMNDFVFADNSMYPRSVARAWWGMETRDALHTWAPERSGDLRLDRKKLTALLAEKHDATRLVRDLASRVRAGSPDLPPDLAAELSRIFGLYETYIEGFLLCAEICLYARWSDPQQRSDDGPVAPDLAQFEAALERLDAFVLRIKPLAESGEHRHQLVMLIDYRRAADVAREGRAALGRSRNMPAAAS